MPELPEVESVVRALKGIALPGNRLISLEIFCSRLPNDLAEQLPGCLLLDISRRGKYLHFRFSQDLNLIVHLRMTGQFLVKDVDDPPQKHERLIFNFENKFRIGFHDTRRFATFDLVTDPDQIFDKLGLEPFDLSLSSQIFYELLAERNKPIKACLLDQSILTGIGNIYADEALWEATIHPLSLAYTLKRADCEKLLKAVRKVLAKGIDNGGTSLGQGAPNFHHLNGRSGENQNTLAVYGRKGEPCMRCGALIEKIIVQQRGTHFCPYCQSL